MASKKNITFFKRVKTKVKGRLENKLIEYQTNGVEKSTKGIIEKLMKEGAAYFEMVDFKKGIKTSYNKLLSGKNYEIKQEEI
ncbi:hypothetical protein V2647_03710 [Tenacibaculum maritimum]|uniref:hypothetical protein n=1 Tax=Tenacibaculum maritimum TaxID=107401 RepID=UPI0012E64150|nr:hypothetical protein [Tenacibaculum maritimum]CAA0150381.1 conserved hypothetical protein [Tenacibaculum maritimum]